MRRYYSAQKLRHPDSPPTDGNVRIGKIYVNQTPTPYDWSKDNLISILPKDDDTATAITLAELSKTEPTPPSNVIDMLPRLHERRVAHSFAGKVRKLGERAIAPFQLMSDIAEINKEDQ